MAKLTIEMDCDNDAFADGFGDEVTRILLQIADRIIVNSARGKDTAAGSVMDVNGNRCGTWRFEPDG